MPLTLPRRPLVSLLVVALCVAPSPAWAKKRIVVTRLAGSTDTVQRALTDIVARDAIVLSDAVWRAAADTR